MFGDKSPSCSGKGTYFEHLMAFLSVLEPIANATKNLETKVEIQKDIPNPNVNLKANPKSIKKKISKSRGRKL
jgi:hypothetical protein